MPHSRIDFSKYEAQAPPSIDFSKYEQRSGPISGTISNSRPESEGNAFERFATRATGIPIHRIIGEPNRYLNPFSREYQNNQDPAIKMPSADEMAAAPIKIPGSDTVADLKAHNYAAAAGDLAPGALMLASMGRFKAAPEVIAPPRALPRGPIEAPGTIEGSQAPAYSATTRAERLGLLLPRGSEPIPVSGQVERTSAPPYATTTRAERLGRLLPEQTPSSRAVRLQSSSEETPSQIEASYPKGLQKRPTDRAEIVSDKAIQDAMRNNLEQHGWQALSQERKEFFANNGPQLGKADLIAQARAEAIRAEAEQRAQQVLAEAANPTVKLTKMPMAKVTAAAVVPRTLSMREPLGVAGDEDYAYHITSADKLPDIAKAGLQPQSSTSFSSYRPSGKVSLAPNGDSAEFWRSEFANEATRKGTPPDGILLRVKRSNLGDSELYPARDDDEQAQLDRAGKEFYPEEELRVRGIPAKQLELLTPQGWRSLSPARAAKSPVPAAAKAQPVAEDLNSPNRLVDLMQQSIDLINSRKGK